MTKPTSEDLSYLAGIIDGEGTFNIYRKQVRDRWKYTARIYVVNTDKRLIDWLQETFGGLVYARTHSQWKTRYEWIIEGTATDALLSSIHSRLIIKRDQCRVVQDFRATMRNRRPITESDYQLRSSLYDLLRQLNARNTPLPRVAIDA